MSKHKMVNDQLLQMNKAYKDLKNRQKDKIADFKEYQAKIQELEAYYTSQQWKDDFVMDGEGGKQSKEKFNKA